MEASGTGEEYNVDILVNSRRNDNNSKGNDRLTPLFTTMTPIMPQLAMLESFKLP